MLLASQGLCGPPPASTGSQDVLETIQSMGLLQIDTIHVVARSPYLVLWSRLGSYEEHLLDDLLAAGKLFEYWAHEACLIPIEKYGIYRRFMLDRVGKSRRWWAWRQGENIALCEGMLKIVGDRGEVKSSEFERTDGQKGGWWNWKEEKAALEFLHSAGDLMISRRVRFQRHYALRQTVHPTWSDELAPSLEDAIKALTADGARCLGVATMAWIADYYRLLKTPVSKALPGLVESGELLPAEIEGIKGKAYLHPSRLALAEHVVNGTVTADRTTLLSPFDPVAWHRDRARELFDFDYTIECYTPGPKRIYGYFTLPILHRGALVGRLDAKAHRKEKVFEVKSLHFEPDVAVDDLLVEELGAALQACAKWHKTPKVKITKSNVKGTARPIQGSANQRRPAAS